jgi:hypothetical protein
MMQVILKNLNIINKFLIIYIDKDFLSYWVEKTSNYFNAKSANKIHFEVKWLNIIAAD